MKRRRLKRKPKYSPHDVSIITVLHRTPFKLSTSEVARRTGMGWNSAKKSLEKFNREKKVTKKKKGNRTYWYM